jgi:hypothetical protein
MQRLIILCRKDIIGSSRRAEPTFQIDSTAGLAKYNESRDAG